MHEFVRQLTAGIVNIVNIFRPEKVILGGGIADGGFIPVEKIAENLQRENYGGDSNVMPDVTNAVLGNRAGMTGAANLI